MVFKFMELMATSLTLLSDHHQTQEQINMEEAFKIDVELLLNGLILLLIFLVLVGLVLKYLL